MLSTLLLYLIYINSIYSLNWIQLTPNASWSPRSFFSAVSYSDRMVILSGAYPNISSVWDSSNGQKWNEDTSLSGISTRFAMSSVTLHNKIISMAGCNMLNKPYIKYNDIWSSIDNGKTWTQIVSSAPWPARCFSSAIVLNNNSILIMGGYELNGYLNDVWRSDDDGLTWILITNSSQWSQRDAFGVLELNGNIFLFGGHDANNIFHNDVWMSNDNGKQWIEIQSNAEWEGRRAFGSVIWNNQLVIMGGEGNIKSFNDVWMSYDGIKWIQLNTTNIWSARQWFAVTNFNQNIFVFGGNINNSVSNDVWVLK